MKRIIRLRIPKSLLGFFYSYTYFVDSGEQRITHSMPDTYLIFANCGKLHLLSDENRHFAESSGSVSEPFSILIGQITFNGIVLRNAVFYIQVVNKHPQILIRISTVMPYMDVNVEFWNRILYIDVVNQQTVLTPAICRHCPVIEVNFVTIAGCQDTYQQKNRKKLHNHSQIMSLHTFTSNASES